ncbi:MAG: type II secretion system protein [Clostridia bacterium]|nr:type II secretion system protein [Clostridia bacterium]
MFKLFYKSKKGLSLIELIITITVLGLVMIVAGTALSQLTKRYNYSTERWQVQNAVRLACSKFENNANYIVNSKEIDIFKEKALDAGIVYDSDTGRWIWQSTPTLITTAADDYTYIFSVKAYEAPDNWDGLTTVSNTSTLTELGYYLFIKYDKDVMDRAMGTSLGTNSNYPACVLFLNNEGFGEVPVQVEFSIGTDYLEGNAATESYMSNSVNIDFKSGNTKIINYNTSTNYVSENLASSKSVGMENGKLIYDNSWKTDNTMNVYPCGWIDASVSGHPEGETLKIYDPNNAENVIYTYGNEINDKGNVLRFLSPLSDKSFEEGSGSAVNKIPSCLGEWTFSSYINSEVYLDNLRNFRDEVLRGTEFGDWFIHQYYYVWSPFLIEHTAFLKPVYRAIMIPVSYICDFIADL